MFCSRNNPDDVTGVMPVGAISFGLGRGEDDARVVETKCRWFAAFGMREGVSSPGTPIATKEEWTP